MTKQDNAHTEYKSLEWFLANGLTVTDYDAQYADINPILDKCLGVRGSDGIRRLPCRVRCPECGAAMVTR